MVVINRSHYFLPAAPASVRCFATGGAHLCSIQYYLRFWLGICRTARRIGNCLIFAPPPAALEQTVRHSAQGKPTRQAAAPVCDRAALFRLWWGADREPGLSVVSNGYWGCGPPGPRWRTISMWMLSTGCGSPAAAPTRSATDGGRQIMQQLKAQAEQKGYAWIDWNVVRRGRHRRHPTPRRILRNVQNDAKRPADLCCF